MLEKALLVTRLFLDGGGQKLISEDVWIPFFILYRQTDRYSR